MSEVIVTESYLGDIAEAIRAKNGTQNTYKPSQMAAAIEALPTATIEPLSVTENGTYTAEQGKAYSPVSVAVPNSYSASDEGKVVSNGALVAQSSDTATQNGTVDTTLINSLTVNVPSGDSQAVTDLVTGVFTKNYTFPETQIGRAFANAIGSYDLSFPNCTTFRNTNYTFENSTFNSVDFPVYTGNVETAFRGCKINHIYVPNATASGESAFRDCINLKEAHYPQMDISARYAFRGCTNLETLVINSVTNYQIADNCPALESVDIGTYKNNAKIDNAFSNDTVLGVLVIRASSVYPLINLTAFTGTKFADGGTGGTLYVPEALISSYQSASNWSTILGYANNQIKAIEGSIYETHYADGTPIS